MEFLPIGRSNRVIQWFPRSTIVMAIFVGVYSPFSHATEKSYYRTKTADTFHLSSSLSILSSALASPLTFPPSFPLPLPPPSLHSIGRDPINTLTPHQMYVGWAAFTIRHYRAVTSIEATKTPIHIKDAKEPVENKSVGSGGEGGKREAECVSWTLKLKGHKYTHEWGEVSYDGLKSDEFATVCVCV
eukprot:1391600-Amorphochlora_amoeboformis.AAC.2